TSKDVEPSKGSKSKESKSSSSSKGTKPQPKSSDDQPNVKAALKHDWFKKHDKPLTPDRAWNTTKSIDFRPPKTWINNIAKARQPPRTFNELMSTPIDFSTYVMNHLKIDNLTQEILIRPAFNFLKGTRKSFVKPAFNFIKPLSFIKDRGRQVVPADYFINNDLECLKGGSSIMKWYDYGYLEEIVVRREDDKLYKFKEGDFARLNLCDIKDMLLLLVQKKLFNLEVDDLYDLGMALWMFTKRIVILHHVELGVESYQKKLNITRPETFRSDITNVTPFTEYKNPQGIIYLDKYKRNRLISSVKVYKFYDGTLLSFRTMLNDIANNLRINYLPKRKWSNLDRQGLTS
nr:hypothetical protein [Tanacetum cinerariifolium]